MRRLLLILPLIVLLAAFPARAGSDLVVVELFTAQGCPACPPADKVLANLAEREDVLALSWAVDYWDYGGWKDTFASPANTERQERYNGEMGYNTVYTPQMIVNGRHQTVGSRPEEVQDLILATGEDLWLPVSLEQTGEGVAVSIDSGDYERTAFVSLIWYDSERDVDIKFGDNQGRRLHYANVVRGHREIGEWSGDEMRVPIDLAAVEESGSNCIAVLVQDGPGGAILGAAKLILANRPRG